MGRPDGLALKSFRRNEERLFPDSTHESQAAQQDTMELQQVNELRICLPVQCATLSLPLPRLFPPSYSAILCAVSLF